jgi:hypothetical protein
MEAKYAAWIAANVEGDGRHMCQGRSKAMCEAFPELRRVRGIYHCLAGDRVQHWWCEAPDGTVVDPTAQQFLSQGDGRYEELSDEYIADHFPIGKCPNCGEHIYKGDYSTSFCTKDCADSYVVYINSFRR